MKSNKCDVSVSEATRRLLKNMPYIRQAMEMDAVNYRGLARSLEEEVLDMTGKKSVNLEAIVMAIKRYEKSGIEAKNVDKIQETLRGSKLSLKNDMKYFTFHKRKGVQKRLSEINSEIERGSSERMYILQSESEIATVLNRENAQKIPEDLIEHDLKNVEENLSMVVMDCPESVLEAHGIIHHLTEKIIFNGIGLTEIFLTYTEFVFLVPDKNSTDLYETLRTTINEARRVG